MGSWSNEAEVLDQLRAAGLQVDSLEVGRLVRCPAEGDRGRSKTGWYSLHELRVGSGDLLLVGAFGNWRDAGAKYKVELKKREISADERAAIRKRVAEDRKRAAAKAAREAKRAAERARSAWAKMSENGGCDYLARKGVQAHGVRFSERGNLLIPMLDANGVIHGLQVIYGDPAIREKKGRDKDYWPKGLEKRGHFHLIGMPRDIVLVAEGYATGASLHEATGLPVAIAFDAGNLQPVAEALRKRYRRARILICGDDDFTTPKNPGMTYASSAALAVGGEWMLPAFAGDAFRADLDQAETHLNTLDDRELKRQIEAIRAGRPKLTDFNDLHQAQGLSAVRTQVEARLRELGWDQPQAPRADNTTQGGGDRVLRPIGSDEELHERYTLIYGGGGAVFDHFEHEVVSLSDMRDACSSRMAHRIWMESPDRKICRKREVGFDPAGTDPDITCNLWGGWPTEPKKGRCDALLDLLEYLCSGEENPRELFHWVLKWLAYPIQHPGAKMKTALVFHGPQGTGKNLFFEAYMAIFGIYGRIVDQDAVEDKFNDWASKKLFMIADEVVARLELYHSKNKLKNLITSDHIRINPKNMAAREESNHVNLVFLSNEVQPLVLEEDDRRYTVIWTPPKLDPRFYRDVGEEIRDGGVAALHHHLLTLDLGDFNEHSKPPMTRSKAELIELGLDSTDRFVRAWFNGDIDGVPVVPCRSQDLFELYAAWCRRVGINKPAPMHVMTQRLGKRRDIKKALARFGFDAAHAKQATFIFPEGQFDPPDGERQGPWLAAKNETFRNAVDDFKQGNAEFRA